MRPATATPATLGGAITIGADDLPGLREFATWHMGGDPWRTILTGPKLPPGQHYEPVLTAWMQDHCDFSWRPVLPPHVPTLRACLLAAIAEVRP